MAKYIEIKMTGCTLFLTEPELSRLLAGNRELWKEALKRGKAFKRASQWQQRATKHR